MVARVIEKTFMKLEDFIQKLLLTTGDDFFQRILH